MPELLTDQVAGLVSAARAAARTPEAAARLDEIADRLRGPLLVAIAGKVKAGKSTLLNAMLCEELAPTDAGECTQIVTWYRQAEQPRVLLHPRTGHPVSRPFQRSNGALEVDLGDYPAPDVDHLEVHWPAPRLRDLTLVDTPGIGSISVEVSARTHLALAPEDDRPPLVDAVLYLLRHAHSTDVRFLESFHDDELAHGTPINTIGVLSRADEIGSCRHDALAVADRIANRYQRDPRLRRLCPVVVPVAGLLGYAGGTLREGEFRALARLAALPADSRVELLLSADRFASRNVPAAVTELERRHLLQRLGLFGVRLALELIESKATPDATSLSGQLVSSSGLDRLRAVLLRQFTHRTGLLKARSALAAFQNVLQSGACSGTDSLRARAEQVVAGAHEFEEVRLLNTIRTDDLGMKPDRVQELDRILGGSGHDPCSRLGLPEDAGPEHARSATLDALARWQRIAEHPISSRAVQLAARGAVRTLEGLLSSQDGAHGPAGAEIR